MVDPVGGTRPSHLFSDQTEAEGSKNKFLEIHSNCIVSYQFFFSIGLHATAKDVQGSIIMLNGGFDLLI